MTKGDTFVTLFDKACASHPDDECYISYDGKLDRKAITFGELRTLASRFSHNLKQHGLKKGDYVVVSTPLSIEYIVASFGVIFAGGIHVSMEKLFTNCEALKNTINMTRAKFILIAESAKTSAWPFFEPKVIPSDGQSQFLDFQDNDLPSLKKIVITNREQGKQNPTDFLTHLRSCTDEFREYDLDLEDSCVTTSSLSPGIATPKLVELSHRAVVNTARLWGRITNFGMVHFWFPWYIGITLPYDALVGKPRVITDTFSKLSTSLSKHHKKVMEAEGLQASIMGPPDIKSLASLYPNKDRKILTHIMTGGQPITKEIFETAQAMSSHIYIVYFISECNLVSCNHIAPGETFTPFDSGFTVDGVEVRILDEDDQEVLRGQTGRIVIRSPYSFTRYPNQGELTQAVWREDGWFYSEDVGCLTPDGHLHVYGRRSDVISRGITLMYPSWIETPIWKLDDVREVMVAPVPDDINFQSTCACVVLRPGSKVTESDIHRMYDESISENGKELIVLDYVLIFDGAALPKLSRDELGELAAAKLGLKSLS